MSCVFQGQRKAINKDELKATIQAIERAHNLCSENKGSSELIADVGTLFSCLKYVPFWVFIWSFISVISYNDVLDSSVKVFRSL